MTLPFRSLLRCVSHSQSDHRASPAGAWLRGGSVRGAPSAQCGANARQTWHPPARHPQLRAPLPRSPAAPASPADRGQDAGSTGASGLTFPSAPAAIPCPPRRGCHRNKTHFHRFKGKNRDWTVNSGLLAFPRKGGNLVQICWAGQLRGSLGHRGGWVTGGARPTAEPQRLTVAVTLTSRPCTFTEPSRGATIAHVEDRVAVYADSVATGSKGIQTCLRAGARRQSQRLKTILAWRRRKKKESRWETPGTACPVTAAWRDMAAFPRQNTKTLHGYHGNYRENKGPNVDCFQVISTLKMRTEGSTTSWSRILRDKDGKASL